MSSGGQTVAGGQSVAPTPGARPSTAPHRGVTEGLAAPGVRERSRRVPGVGAALDPRLLSATPAGWEPALYQNPLQHPDPGAARLFR